METIRPLKFGTLSLPDRESRIVCRTILLDMLGEATINVTGGDLSGVTGLFWKYVSLSLATIYFPRVSINLMARGVNGSDVVIMRAIDGPLVIQHRNKRIELAPHDIIFVPADASSTIELPEGGRFDCAHMPAYAIAGMSDHLKPLIMKKLSTDCLPLGLLTNYAGYLLRQEYQSEQDAAMMVAHFYDLLPVLTQHVNSIAAQEAPQTRMASIKAVIENNLANGNFSIADVAELQGVTPRAIQKFFSREGTTFSKYVLERRLALAKDKILKDGSTLSISQMAYDCGFNDLSYFNRTFRARYDARPSDLRRMYA
jgi:AraC-like DNA-binding protein